MTRMIPLGNKSTNKASQAVALRNGLYKDGQTTFMGIIADVYRKVL